MTEQLSPEPAEEITRFGKPVMVGMLTIAAAGFITGKATTLAEDYSTQLDIQFKINHLESELGTIEAADELITDDLINSDDVHHRQTEISELRAQKNELGSEAANFAQGYGPSLALGLVVMSVGLKRAWNKSRINKK